MCKSAFSFAAHQRLPAPFPGTAAAATRAQECSAHTCACPAGACDAHKRGQTTEENELAEQLCSELLSSSGSIVCNFDGTAEAAAAISHAAAALADLLCHEGCPEEAAAAVAHLFPAAQAISVHCGTASCPGQLTLELQPSQLGACCVAACTCSAADVLLRSTAAACTLHGCQQPLSEADQAALAALGEMLGKQLRHHVKQQLEVLHATVASLRIQHASGRCSHGVIGH